jgi:hypothetical protein
MLRSMSAVVRGEESAVKDRAERQPDGGVHARRLMSLISCVRWQA